MHQLVNGGKEGPMDEWVDVFMGERMGEWMNGWMSRWVGGWVGGWGGADGWKMGGWTDGIIVDAFSEYVVDIVMEGYKVDGLKDG
jgi:hypothetical protein